jgi:hypothetical protein
MAGVNNVPARRRTMAKPSEEECDDAADDRSPAMRDRVAE